MPLQLRQPPRSPRTEADGGQSKSCRWYERRGLGSCGLGVGHRRPGKNDHHLLPERTAIPAIALLRVSLSRLDLTELSPPAGSWPGRQPPPSTPAPSSCKTRRPSRRLRRRRRIGLRAAAASGEGLLSPARGKPAPRSGARQPVTSQLCP